MYTIAVVVSSGELLAYPWMNPSTLFKDNKLYSFQIFQREQCPRLLAEMQLNGFDGVIISSNAANDPTLHDFFIKNKKVVSRYIESGHGVLLLLQYHLAKLNKAFDIISKSLFEGLNDTITNDNPVYSVNHLKEHGSVSEREQNAIVLTNGQFDESKMYLDEDSLLMSYPNKITLQGLYNQSQNSKYVPAFLPAYIADYQRAYFKAPLSIVEDGNPQKSNAPKPVIIYSANEKKRLIISTLPVDLQEQTALYENMISYISRGRPEAVLWQDDSCSNCRGNCDTEDYLSKSKVHFCKVSHDEVSEKQGLISSAKYVIACGETGFDTFRQKSCVLSLPIKTPLSRILKENSMSSDKRVIVDIPSKSPIETWANQGLDYITSQFPQNDRLDNKWDSLYTTRQVILLSKEINRNIPSYIVDQISNYLKSHNQDNETFDKVDRATVAANEICQALNLQLNFKSKPNINVDEDVLEDTQNINSASLVELAIRVLATEKVEKINNIYQIIARFITERNFEKASWNDDVMTTALVLRALCKIDNSTHINTSVTNIVCSCYQNIDCSELNETLTDSIERSRQAEYDIRVKYVNSIEKYEAEKKHYIDSISQKNTTISTLTETNSQQGNTIIEYEDFNNSLKNKNSRLAAWLISTSGIMISLTLLFVSFIVHASSIDQAHYLKEVNAFFISWGIGGAVLDVVAIVITIKLFKILYKTDYTSNGSNKEKSGDKS